jgi:hypothetical protein
MYVVLPKTSGNLTIKSLLSLLLVSTVSFKVVPMGLGYLSSQGYYFEEDGGNWELR